MSYSRVLTAVNFIEVSASFFIARVSSK